MIIKQIPEIKTTLNPTNSLVTYNENSTDKTTQNSDNVIDKTIQNNNKELFKNKKNTNKNFGNTKTLRTTDNFTSTCVVHPRNKKNASANGKKARPRLTKRKNRKRSNKIITMRLRIGTTTTVVKRLGRTRPKTIK